MKLKMMAILTVMTAGSTVFADVKTNSKGQVDLGSVVLTKDTMVGGNCPLNLDNAMLEAIGYAKQASRSVRNLMIKYAETGVSQKTDSPLYKKFEDALNSVNYSAHMDKKCISVIFTRSEIGEPSGAAKKVKTSELLVAKIKSAKPGPRANSKKVK